MPNGKKSWSDAEDALLRERFADTEDDVLGEKLGRTGKSVRTRAWRLKLRKSRAFTTAKYAAHPWRRYRSCEKRE